MGNPSSNVITSGTLQIQDVVSQAQPTVFTRNIGPLVCGTTQIIMQEFLSVPPAGITVTLGQSYGVVYVRNTSTLTIILAITIPGPNTQNWSIPPGGFLLYATPSPANPTLGQPITSVNITAQTPASQNFPVEVIFGQVT